MSSSSSSPESLALIITGNLLVSSKNLYLRLSIRVFNSGGGNSSSPLFFGSSKASSVGGSKMGNESIYFLILLESCPP